MRDSAPTDVFAYVPLDSSSSSPRCSTQLYTKLCAESIKPNTPSFSFCSVEKDADMKLKGKVLAGYINRLRKGMVLVNRDYNVALLKLAHAGIRAELKKDYGIDNEGVCRAIIAAIERVWVDDWARQ